jgi:hypothetical protein
METCFYFNELAQTKLEAGYARRVDYAEAVRILYQAEEAGLIHNVINCKGKIQTLCNCWSCSCPVIKAMVHGQTNVGAPSRYTAVVDTGLCQLHGTVSVPARKKRFTWSCVAGRGRYSTIMMPSSGRLI